MSSPRVRSTLVAREVQQLLLAAGLACVAALPVSAQTQQIPAGTTGSLNSGSTSKPGSKQKKILHDALTPKTRETLQQAMDSTPDAK